MTESIRFLVIYMYVRLIYLIRVDIVYCSGF